MPLQTARRLIFGEAQSTKSFVSCFSSAVLDSVSPSENNNADDSHVEVVSKDVVGKGNGERINKEVFVADGADDDLNDDLFADAVEPDEESEQAEPQGEIEEIP